MFVKKREKALQLVNPRLHGMDVCVDNPGPVLRAASAAFNLVDALDRDLGNGGNLAEGYAAGHPAESELCVARGRSPPWGVGGLVTWMDKFLMILEKDIET